jgi:hypothetical protein
MTQSNKSLDASGGSVFRIIIGRGGLNEIAPPRQLRRWIAFYVDDLSPAALQYVANAWMRIQEKNL